MENLNLRDQTLVAIGSRPTPTLLIRFQWNAAIDQEIVSQVKIQAHQEIVLRLQEDADENPKY